jgi:hypothetical protein
VCGCLDGHNQPQHSCCKRQKNAKDSVSGRGCCDTDCMAQRSETLIQKRTEPASKIKFEAIEELAEMPRMAFERVVALDVVRISPFANHRLKYSRAPELYLHHCAFLI